MTLFLFDVDGTLVRTGGAGRAAMIEAGRRLFGVEDLFSGRDFAGAVDTGIVSHALFAAGLAPTARRLGRFRQVYLRALRRRLPAHPGALLPGVEAVLAALAGRAMLGLQTGNWEEGARLKLGHYGVLGAFPAGLGGFGDDGPARDGLLAAALPRARRRGWDGRRVVVLGDTPLDVLAARRAWARLPGRRPELVTVALPTGVSPREELEAAGPDLLLEDLVAGRHAIVALGHGG